MKAWASTLAVGLLLSAELPASVAMASDPGQQRMLERANYWLAQHRLDLAGATLNKLLALNPAQPDALYQLGVLARERGDSADAQRYFDRLRRLAPADTRAAELVAMLGRQEAPPDASGAAAASIPAAAQLAASADSDDLLPHSAAARGGAAVVPAPRALTVANGTGPIQPTQVAALPQTTVADGSTAAVSASTAIPAGANDPGITAKPVQVAQVELEPPLPLTGYQQATTTPYSPTDTLEMDIDRSLAQLEGQSNPMLIAGIGFRAHSGDDGLDRLNEVGVPIQGSFSPWYTGTATIAVLPVYLDAGSVSTGDLRQFGANPLLSAAGIPLVSPGDQSAAGVGLLGTYSWQDFTGQFGTTPLGFPVTNYVGDVAYQPKFLDNTLSLRFEGLRQPVTDSVLSYAGTHANLAAANAIAPGAFGTNATWGGVIKTGAHVGVFYDDQTYGGYGGAGLAWLTGTNVAQNGVLDALLGTYFRPWKTDTWAIRVGVSAFYTSYDKNLAGFTFGQGGYFSPQDYEALTFPIEYTGNNGPWNWLASVAAGIQHFNASSSPVFPNNPGAQLALETLAPATAFFSATHSTGPAINLKGQLEYAVDPTLTVGVSASFDNGNNWDEGIAKIYLRKTFDWFAPVAVKNDPESIAARDQPASRL